MADQSYSKPLKFASLMMRFVSIPLFFETLDGEGNIKNSFVNMRMREIDTTELSDFMHSVLPDLDKEVLEEEKVRHLKETEAGLRQETEDLFPVLFNQALVMCCTILESFLCDCLEVMMPLPIVFLETEQDIDRLTDLLDSGASGDAYDESLQNKILRKFDFAGIKEKVEILRKVGVDFDAALTFRHKMRPKSIQYALDDAKDFLFGAYSKRNDVVHRGQLPLKSYSDLEAVSEFFAELMMNVALIVRDAYGLPTDFDVMLSDPRNIDLDPSE